MWNYCAKQFESVLDVTVIWPQGLIDRFTQTPFNIAVFFKIIYYRTSFFLHTLDSILDEAHPVDLFAKSASRVRCRHISSVLLRWRWWEHLFTSRKCLKQSMETMIMKQTEMIEQKLDMKVVFRKFVNLFFAIYVCKWIRLCLYCTIVCCLVYERTGHHVVFVTGCWTNGADLDNERSE